MTFEIVKSWKCFGGRQHVFAHASSSLGCRMEVAVYVPPQAQHAPVPVVMYLSGLTCTWENATIKAGFQRVAAQLGLAVVCPDTSPRGPGVADDPSDDLGQGAGFYVNATQGPWAQHYRMDDYIVLELLQLLGESSQLDMHRVSLMGHSMGGHGALVLGLRNASRFASISALSPIVAPTEVPWGQKALTAYLGADRGSWRTYDACQVVREHQHPSVILIDQGTEDPFLAQLVPERFEAAAQAAGQSCQIRRQDGYDHSYYFISTFIEDHLRHHASNLGLP